MTNSSAWPGATTAPDYAVYLGIWTNWAGGRVMGSTLTTTRQNGTLLIAFTAFFIGIVASRFWSILALVLHRLYSRLGTDALHHQRQAVLRNSSAADNALWLFIRIAWAWKKRESLIRTLPVMLCALVSISVFIVAGGFSSQISSGISNNVLLNGENCGVVPFGIVPSNLSQDVFADIQVANGQIIDNAANYVQQCYSETVSTFFACNTFVKSRLASSVDANAPCPINRQYAERHQTFA
jgi:hypothetical protein